MRILHILDHSLPLHSGYTFRTRAILKAQQALGLEVAGVTGARHVRQAETRDGAWETHDGLRFFRGGAVPGVVFHTDQGSEYTARSFRQACERLGIAQSMGRPGSAPGNAVTGSWHSTLEFELRSLRQFATRAEARTAVAAWTGDYNHVRRHSALGMRSPVDYERSLAGRDAA